MFFFDLACAIASGRSLTPTTRDPAQLSPFARQPEDGVIGFGD